MQEGAKNNAANIAKKDANDRCRMRTDRRKTKETDIAISLNLDGKGLAEVRTGIGFFDHMLTAFAVHGSFDLRLTAGGDLEVDGHHTVEDCGIVMGQALKGILDDFAGIARYGNMLLPMDEALAQVALDLSGRAFLRYDVQFRHQMTGDYDLNLTKEFFRAFAHAAGVTLHIRLLEGENDHHSCEAIYKAFAHALRQAVAPLGREDALSAKGILV